MIGDLFLGFAAGSVLGLVFFGGLRWTVSLLAAARHPLMLAAASLLLRSALVAGGLVAVAGGEPARLFAGLAGILAARTLLVALARRGLAAEGGPSWI